MSHGNTIERNRLSQLAQRTRDLGGLSFIGTGHSGTVVRHNCVREVVGMDMDDSGRLMRPFFTWSVYWPECEDWECQPASEVHAGESAHLSVCHDQEP